MNKRYSGLILALLIGLLIVAIGMGFLFGISNPVSWILMIAIGVILAVARRKVEPDLLQWQESYSVGVEVLDNDHKRLIELLNKFQTAYDFDAGESFEKQALDELVDYTVNHFKREEEMMERTGYPDIENHKAQHKEMIDRVQSYIDDYSKRGPDAFDTVSAYLKEWLISHINGTDKAYACHLNEHGIK